MQFLKLSTAATVIMGPFVDLNDGVTPETGLAAGTVDEIGVYKHDAIALTDISGTTTFTHRAGGMYTMTLSTGDTNTVGRMTAYVRDDSVCLPVWKDFMVLPAHIYDGFVAGSDYMQVDTVQVSSDATAANNLELDYDGTGYNKANSTIGTVTALSAAAIDSVWDEPLAGHTTNDTPGDVLNMLTQDAVTLATDVNLDSIIGQMLDNGTAWSYDRTTDALEVIAAGAGAAAIADAVWDELLSGHTIAGSAGEAQSPSLQAGYTWDHVLESGANVNARTAAQITRLIVSALCGTDADVGDWSALSIDGSKTRISGTLDASGRREAVTILDGS